MSENEIVNPNADAQESAPVTPMPVTEVPTATTNAPGEDGWLIHLRMTLRR
jgi:hypothetical protein